MAKNKVTMDDIAKACGVSVATVSYVLNHSEKEKISHEVCLKVMEAATRLHYTPCLQSKRAAKHRSNLVGIIIHLDEADSPGKKLLYYDLAAELSRRMSQLGYETLELATSNLDKPVGVISKHSLDAVFMIDFDSSIIGSITRSYYVPILFLYCETNDRLFCNIYYDYADILKRAMAMLKTDSLFLMMEDIYSPPLRQLLTRNFLSRDVFVNRRGADMESFLLEHRHRKGIVFGDILAMQAIRMGDVDDFAIVSSVDFKGLFPSCAHILTVRNSTVAATAVETLRHMLRFDYKANAENRILLGCESAGDD